MTTHNTEIRTIVMRRVRTIHALRASATSVGVSILILAVSLYFIGREVWVARVFENMPNVEHVSALFSFFSSAFLTTEFAVQVLVVLMLLAIAWLVRGIGKVLFIQPMRFA